MASPGNSPKLYFSSSYGTSSIKLEVLPEGTVSFMGTAGGLFEVVDSISGSLMSVNDASGLPILEVFSDDRVVAGKYNANTLVVTGSSVAIGKSVPNAVLDVLGAATVSGSFIQTGSLFRSYANTTRFRVGESSTNWFQYMSASAVLHTDGYSDYTTVISSGKRKFSNAGTGVNLVYWNFTGGGGEMGINNSGSFMVNGSGSFGKALVTDGNANAVLDVNGSAIITGSLTLTSTGLNTLATFKNAFGSARVGMGAAGMFVGGQAGIPVIFQSSGSNVAGIDLNGNFGIGKAADMNARLDVSGSAIITGSLIVASGNGNNDSTTITPNKITITDPFGTTDTGLFVSSSNAAGRGFLCANIAGVRLNTTGTSGNLYLGTLGDASAITVNSSGNIGVAKTSGINAKLDINGNTIISGSLIVTGDVQADYTPHFLLMGA